LTHEVALAERLCEIAEQHVEAACAKAKHVRDKLENMKKQYEQAKGGLQKALQEMEEEHQHVTEQEVLKLEEEIERLKEQEEKESIPITRSSVEGGAMSDVSDGGGKESTNTFADSASVTSGIVRRRDEGESEGGQPSKRIKLLSELEMRTMELDKNQTANDDSRAEGGVEFKGPTASNPDSAGGEARKGDVISGDVKEIQETSHEKSNAIEEKKQSDIKKENVEVRLTLLF